jgi:hypothetical protein
VRRLAPSLLLVAAFVLAVAPGAARAGCIKPQKVAIAHGIDPTGAEWTADAGVKKNTGCGEWLWSVEFTFAGFGWGTSTGLQVGQHLGRYAKISGYAGPITRDESESAAFGYVGQEVATIKLAMSDGTRLEIRPHFVPADLRRSHVWLRGFKPFIRFYPGHAYVRSLWLYTRQGQLFYRQLHARGDLH